jgi:trehalose 6-phosphate synthase/phosphatase
MKSVGDGTPEAILARELELGLERLDVRALESAYAETKKRVIIIDFNGTLVAKEAPGKYLKREILGTSGFKPSPIAAMALSRLAKDPLNTVYVVSGDSQHNLEIAVGDIPGLGLAASNGACFADPGGRERTWQYLDFGVDWNEVKKVGGVQPSMHVSHRLDNISSYTPVVIRPQCLSSPSTQLGRTGRLLN